MVLPAGSLRQAGNRERPGNANRVAKQSELNKTMRSCLKSRHASREQGAVLLASLFVVAVLGITLGSYLLLVRNDYVLTARSQYWNATLAVAEAGVEEAMAQLNPGPFVSPSMVDRSANQWNLDDDGFYKPAPRILANGASYRVGMSADPS